MTIILFHVEEQSVIKTKKSQIKLCPLLKHLFWKKGPYCFITIGKFSMFSFLLSVRLVDS